jgi:gliding motility-associated-like protein
VTVASSAEAYIPSTGGQLIYPTGILSSSGFSYVNDVLNFPAGDGPLYIKITPLSLLGAPSNLVPPTASNRYALGSLYPQVYSVTTVPDNFKFQFPVQVTLWYATTSLSAAAASPSFGASSSAESSLGFFVYDSVRGEWRPASANQNLLDHTMTTQIMYAGSSLNLLGIFPSVAIAPQDFRPAQKIITPNGDGINDTLDFGNLGSDASIDIYDVRGRRVRHLAGAFSWDGRDDSGSVVPSGVYIYQYQLNGQRVSGVVAVAK